jgi:hypothetical protein
VRNLIDQFGLHFNFFLAIHTQIHAISNGHLHGQLGVLSHLHQLPVNGGANFVDLGLKTVVKNCPGTLIAFQPEFLHGTTENCGVDNYILALPSTRRVHDAYMELEENGAKIEFGILCDRYEDA